MKKRRDGGNPGKTIADIKSEIANHNSEIKAIYGSRGVCTVRLIERSQADPTLAISFTYPVTREGFEKPQQYNLGFGSALIPLQLTKAKTASHDLTRALANKSLSANYIDFWEYVDYNILGKPKNTKAPKIIGDLIESYKLAFIANYKNYKNPLAKWYNYRGRYLEKLPDREALTEKILREFMNSLKDNEPSKKAYTAIKALLEYHHLEDEFSSALNCRKFSGKETEKRETYVPTDDEIIEVWSKGFSFFRIDGRKKTYKNIRATKAYQFIFGIMATYGIRAHEFWHIRNWHKPVDISAKEWIEVDSDDADDATDDEYGTGRIQLNSDRIIPAFFDPNNDFPILVIGDDTKTGKRLAMPLSPIGDNWIERFHLKDELILPDIKDPLKLTKSDKSLGAESIIKSLGTGKYSTIAWHNLPGLTKFSSHKLRHAYTHRGRCIGIDPWKLAQSQGHTLTTAESVYAKHLASRQIASMLKEEWKQVHSNLRSQKLTKNEAFKLYESLKAETTDMDLIATKLIDAIYG
jgi:integrase